ncbi:MAG: phosphoglycerate dehydrogenase [Phycisphaerales bacterium]|nr:phosphoglycerate dehydrogenase [Phycisphaerales bacterium]
MFKVLVADKIADEGLALLKQQPDVEFTNQPKWNPGELAGVIGNYDGVIIRSGVKIKAEDLAKPGRLKGIARAGVGVDNVDVEAATRAGVLVMNTPDANTITTAEHAVALMLALSRKLAGADAHVRAGLWERNKYMGTQLAGKTLGIIGLGRIGRAVAKRAAGLEMKVLAYDPFFFAESALDGQVRMIRDLDELLPQCDYITVHVPGDKTKGLIDAGRLARCRKGVRFINCARGGIIDEAALAEAIKSGSVGGAAIDVYDQEPPPKDHPLFGLGDKVLLTPHLGASTAEAQSAVSVDAVHELLLYLRGDGIQGAVNAGGIDLNLSEQEQAYADLARRMGSILGAIADKGFSTVTLRTNGELPKRIAPTLQRLGIIELLKAFISEPLNVVNVLHLAEQRGINLRLETLGQATQRAIQHSIELEIVDGDRKHTIIGTVFADNLPRVLCIKGYWMDMVPAGPMVLIVNRDKPGVIGLVGNTFGRMQINIADMTISRKGDKALMLLKLDAPPTAEAMDALAADSGIEVVKALNLPLLSKEPHA